MYQNIVIFTTPNHLQRMKESYTIETTNRIRTLFKGYTPDRITVTAENIKLFCSTTDQSLVLVSKFTHLSPWHVNPDLPQDLHDVVYSIVVDAMKSVPNGFNEITASEIKKHFETCFRSVGLFAPYSSF